MTGEMRIVHAPEPKHSCGPNNKGHMGMNNWNEPPGTVIECSECGKSWVAYRPNPQSGYMGVLWRREGIFERRRRLKKKPFNTN